MKVTVNGRRVNYDIEGPRSAPVIVLSHALGVNLSMWEPQMAAMTRKFRVLRYDVLGHGETDVPPGPYKLEQLAEQAAGLLETLEIGRAHFLGLSMGGMIAQVLALTRSETIDGLILCDTSSRVAPESQPQWQERIRIVESEGMEPLVEPTLGRWFTPPFGESRPEIVEKVRNMLRSNPPAGYAACCHAVAALNLTERLDAIRLRTLIVVGAQDPGTPVSASEVIHKRIAGSKLVILPSASHLSNMEQPEAFNEAVLTFLEGGGM